MIFLTNARVYIKGLSIQKHLYCIISFSGEQCGNGTLVFTCKIVFGLLSIYTFHFYTDLSNISKPKLCILHYSLNVSYPLHIKQFLFHFWRYAHEEKVIKRTSNPNIHRNTVKPIKQLNFQALSFLVLGDIKYIFLVPFFLNAKIAL